MSGEEPEEAKAIREKVRKAPVRVAQGVFDDPDFQRQMNRWMIGTHISWGITLAMSFIALNYLLIWLTQAFGMQSWVPIVTFGPVGIGYLAWQWWKYRRKTPKTDANSNTPE